MKSKKLMYALFGLSALATSQITNASVTLTSTYFPPNIGSENFMFSSGSIVTNGNIDSTFNLLLAGSSPDSAFIGTLLTGGSGWSFSTTNTGNTIFFDPAVAVGYLFNSDVALSGVTVGYAYGDDLYDLSVWDGSGALNDVASYTPVQQNWNGDLYSLGSNITKILISGIETSAAIDPANPNGFVTGFTFDAALGAPINLTQIPVVTAVPLPQAWLLLGLGLLGMRAMRAKSSKV